MILCIALREFDRGKFLPGDRDHLARKSRPIENVARAQPRPRSMRARNPIENRHSFADFAASRRNGMNWVEVARWNRTVGDSLPAAMFEFSEGVAFMVPSLQSLGEKQKWLCISAIYLASKRLTQPMTLPPVRRSTFRNPRRAQAHRHHHRVRHSLGWSLARDFPKSGETGCNRSTLQVARAANAVALLPEAERARGIWTISAGTPGRCGLRRTPGRGPMQRGRDRNGAPAKLERMRARRKLFRSLRRCLADARRSRLSESMEPSFTVR